MNMAQICFILQLFIQQITINLGYPATHADVTMSTTPSLINSLRYPGTTLTGVMPSAVYSDVEGWKDTAVFYTDLSSFRSGAEKWKQTHTKQKLSKLSRL